MDYGDSFSCSPYLVHKFLIRSEKYTTDIEKLENVEYNNVKIKKKVGYEVDNKTTLG